MDLPKPPEDQELKNIIDKLAQFVARNGPEFEQMTKFKQKDNKKFAFLFGGEFFNYYQYKVTTEQAIINQKNKMPMDHHGNDQWSNQAEMASAEQPMMAPVMTQQQLQDQIRESEHNLSAQHQVLLQQQQTQIEEIIHLKQEKKLQDLSAQCEFSIEDMECMIQPIIDSCTKEAISNGKSWIFAHAQSQVQCAAIVAYLLKKVISSKALFELKLHIIYLMNDVIHHSLRKHMEYLKQALDTIVIPVFCNASIGSDEDGNRKLSKLLKLWETNEYFSMDIIEQLKTPATSLANYQASLITEYAGSVQPIIANIQSQYANLQQQHNEFVSHATAQFNASMAQPQQIATPGPPPPQQQHINHGLQPEPMHEPINGNMPYQDQQLHSFPPQNYMPPTNEPSGQFPANQQPAYNQNQPNSFGAPPGPPFPPGPQGMVPDLSRPPPGFPPLANAAPPPMPIIPTVPFFELPAGLIVPLIKLDDDEYTPLDSKEIRLPPPTPPSDRLLAAVEAFYAPPSHENPRNSEGWEQLGLYEFFKAKTHAKKRKQELIEIGAYEPPAAPSPERRDEPEEKPKFEEQKIMYQRRSRSKSPPRRRYKEMILTKEQRAKSRSQSRSPPPYQRSSRSPSPRRRSRSRSPVRRSPSRSPTPPSFFGSNYAKPMDQKIDESNKGHQLLKRMGWGGAGLGAAEQGRQDPINAGDIRDKQDQYKGIGVSLNDPFESFRKSKGQAFITRMKARAEENSKLS